MKKLISLFETRLGIKRERAKERVIYFFSLLFFATVILAATVSIFFIPTESHGFEFPMGVRLICIIFFLGFFCLCISGAFWAQQNKWNDRQVFFKK